MYIFSHPERLELWLHIIMQHFNNAVFIHFSMLCCFQKDRLNMSPSFIVILKAADPADPSNGYMSISNWASFKNKMKAKTWWKDSSQMTQYLINLWAHTHTLTPNLRLLPALLSAGGLWLLGVCLGWAVSVVVLFERGLVTPGISGRQGGVHVRGEVWHSRRNFRS